MTPNQPVQQQGPPDTFAERVALQLHFASRIHEVTGLPPHEAWWHYTQLSRWLMLEAPFDTTNSVWQTFCRCLDEATDPVSATVNFRRQREKVTGWQRSTSISSPFGPFSYDMWPGGRLRLHFMVSNPGPVSLLAHSEVASRKMELTTLFAHVKANEIDVTSVVGGSWLYNLNAYHRLYPDEFIDSAHVGADEHQFVALWGQFYDRFGQLRPGLVDSFKQSLGEAKDLAQLNQAFPFQVLRLECGVDAFYRHYQLV